MQPDTDERPDTGTSGTVHPLDYTNLANQGTHELVAFLGRLGQNRNPVPSIGGAVAAELLTRDDYTQRRLADETGIPQSTIDRWIAPFRAVAS